MFPLNGRRSGVRAVGRTLTRFGLVGGMLLATGAAEPAGAQTLEVVLFRAQQYLAGFERQLSAIVSEEDYHQEVRRRDRVRRERDLRSDVLMVWVQADEGWMVFRDVFEVNGREVRDRQRRLEELFLTSPETAIDQAREIAEESARFNIGEIQRNFNVPTMALRFLHPAVTPRLSFEKHGEEAIDGVPTWEVRFTEYLRPTLVRSGSGDIFSRGSFWIEPSEGRIVRTHIIVGDDNTDVRAEVTVSYRPDENLGFWVPGTMVEVYDRPDRERGDVIHGTATYDRFRTFQVQVEETTFSPDEEEIPDTIDPDPRKPAPPGV